MPLLIVLIVAAVLVIDWFVAKEFYRISCDKGYPEQKYLWIAFLLGIIGYILIAAMPNKNKTDNLQVSGNAANNNVAPSPDELPEL